MGGIEHVTTPEQDAQVTPHRSQLTPRTRELVYGPSPEPTVPVTPFRAHQTPTARRLIFDDTTPSRGAKRKLTYDEIYPSPKQLKSSLEFSVLDTSASLFSPIQHDESIMVRDPPESYNDFQPDLTSTRMVADSLLDTRDDVFYQSYLQP